MPGGILLLIVPFESGSERIEHYGKMEDFKFFESVERWFVVTAKSVSAVCADSDPIFYRG